MDKEKNRYRFVGKVDNDGHYNYETDLIISEETLQIIGEEGMKEMREEIRNEILPIKQRIYGEISAENEDTVGLPDEIFFEDNITGAIISFTKIVNNNPNNYSELMFFTKYGEDYTENDADCELHLTKIKSIEDQRELLNLMDQSLAVVKFRPKLHRSQIK